MEYREEILTFICSSIIQKFGMSTPSAYSKSEYQLKESEIEKEIKNGEHVSENDWPGCSEILLNRIHLSENFKSEDKLSEVFDYIRPDRLMNDRSLGKRFVLIVFS